MPKKSRQAYNFEMIGGICIQDECAICLEPIEEGDDVTRVPIPDQEDRENCYHTEELREHVRRQMRGRIAPTDPLTNLPLSDEIVNALLTIEEIIELQRGRRQPEQPLHEIPLPIPVGFPGPVEQPHRVRPPRLDRDEAQGVIDTINNENRPYFKNLDPNRFPFCAEEYSMLCNLLGTKGMNYYDWYHQVLDDPDNMLSFIPEDMRGQVDLDVIREKMDEYEGQVELAAEQFHGYDWENPRSRQVVRNGLFRTIPITLRRDERFGF